MFGGGGTDDSKMLYCTAGLANEGYGLFGTIAAASPAVDCSLTANPRDTTVSTGATATFAITVSPANGFACSTLSCPAPTGVTYTLNLTTVTPGPGGDQHTDATISGAMQSSLHWSG